MHRRPPTLQARPGGLPRPQWLVTVGAIAALAGLAWWRMTPEPVERATLVVQEPPGWGAAPSPFGAAAVPTAAAPLPSPVASTASVAPAPLPAPGPASPAPLSILVAPGVHLTPMSVPPGTLPMPAGPQPHDSEPEN